MMPSSPKHYKAREGKVLFVSSKGIESLVGSYSKAADGTFVVTNTSLRILGHIRPPEGTKTFYRVGKRRFAHFHTALEHLFTQK